MGPSDEPASRFITLPSWLLTQSAMLAGRLVADGLAAVDARGYHYRVLATLDDFGPASQADLGRRSGIHFSDVVTAINELADRNLVERATDPDDRRRNVITITPTGRRQLRRLHKQVIQVQDELLAPLSPDEQGQLAGLLVRILEHHARTPRSGDRPDPS